MPGNYSYRERWKRKLAAYRKENILTLEEGGGINGTLLITEEEEGVCFDASRINELIKKFIMPSVTKRIILRNSNRTKGYLHGRRKT